MKLKMHQVLQAARDAGFDAACEIAMQAISFIPEAHEFCAQNLCGRYNNNWSCPPQCGTPKQMSARVGEYSSGVLVQTQGALHALDDTKTLQVLRNAHTRRYYPFAEQMRSLYGKVLPMSFGECRICKRCSFPDEPCRHPEKRVSSISAYGIDVTKICEASGMEYQYYEEDQQLHLISAVLFK